MIAQSCPRLFNFDIHITIFGLIGEFGYKRCLIVEIRCLNMVFPPEEIGMLLRKDLICSYKDFCGQAYQSQIETHIYDKQLYINVTIGELQLSRSICERQSSESETFSSCSFHCSHSLGWVL